MISLYQVFGGCKGFFDNMTDKRIALQNYREIINLYDISVSYSLDDKNWDRFLQETSAGHHVQSTMWASLKQMQKWECVRVIMSKDNQILAGAQLLVKHVGFFGKVAYLPQGPVIRDGAQIDYTQILQMVDLSLKEGGISVVFITPPRNAEGLCDYLESQGIVPHDIPLFPRATTMIDLEPDLDTILSNMKSKTRYNVRYGKKKGVEIVEVGRDKLPIFHKMLSQTGERNDFVPSSLNYFEAMHDLFSENDHFRLIFAEHEGEIISSILLIAFGDTVLYKRGGWSGEKGNLRPNEALHWDAIEWSKAHGYRYYDFEGIQEDVARAALRGEDIPNSALNTYSRFKLGFGGDVLILPKTYVYSRNPLFKWIGNQKKIVELGVKLASSL